MNQPFHFERIHVYETYVVGAPRKLPAIRTKSEDFSNCEIALFVRTILQTPTHNHLVCEISVLQRIPN